MVIIVSYSILKVNRYHAGSNDDHPNTYKTTYTHVGIFQCYRQSHITVSVFNKLKHSFVTSVHTSEDIPAYNIIITSSFLGNVNVDEGILTPKYLQVRIVR